jgi:hypothetical protein
MPHLHEINERIFVTSLPESCRFFGLLVINIVSILVDIVNIVRISIILLLFSLPITVDCSGTCVIYFTVLTFIIYKYSICRF